MIKRLIYTTLLLATTPCWSQIPVTGTVVFKEDNSVAPGINVVEKGTMNGTQTGNDGTFRLIVIDPNAVLVFSFIGAITQEFQLKGNREIYIKLKLDCNKDFFDSQQVHIYANSGVINNPIGGQIDIASPWIFHGVIKGSYSYQANLDENVMQVGKVELTHYVGNCDFDMDFRWTYRQVTYNSDLNFKTNSFETDLNLKNVKLIAGYSHLDITTIELADNKELSGFIFGMGRYFNIPLHPTGILKVGLYKNKVEYQASIQGGHKRFLCFLKFYKLESFNELSVGIGTGLGYGAKKGKR